MFSRAVGGAGDASAVCVVLSAGDVPGDAQPVRSRIKMSRAMITRERKGVMTAAIINQESLNCKLKLTSSSRIYPGTDLTDMRGIDIVHDIGNESLLSKTVAINDE
ncbi:MAG TPA: hypothetical protein VK654_08315 [Nitrospirota bacterium]|nr:hypothetical protein [Nitrospirota bacterium]